MLTLMLIVAVCLQSCEARLEVFDHRSSSHHLTNLLDRRDARTLMVGSNDPEGENHTAIEAPRGSQFVGIPIGGAGMNEELAVYMTKDGVNMTATHAYIMIHGKVRNGAHYWKVLNRIVKKAAKAGTPGADTYSIIVAPEFFSARYNKGQYTSDMLAWGDINLWEAGDPAVHPKGTTVNAIDALDGLVRWFQNATIYPNIRNVTVVGHGGGGQLAQRFAAVGQATSTDRVHVRYIHGDPSSGVYFTSDRASMANQTLPTVEECPLYDTWRYGLNNYTSSISATLSAQQYFRQYTSRDVISIVGYLDLNNTGDNTCAARMQGGEFRRDRNLVWWRYINTLARTAEDLTGFPGVFASLPDWSNVTSTPNQIATKLIVISDADHNVTEVFSSQDGQAALFTDASQLPTGWRPNGWRAPLRASTNKDGQTSSAMPQGGVTVLVVVNVLALSLVMLMAVL